ncbi:MAG TPA: hypothetical protein VFV59_09045, partial [Candidatus Limnocylindria bacterium]|nr:hypothetical protein [Candidatus Limnocylindria bacterium]
MKHEIRYGKADVKVYRTYAEPLTGVTPIPESPFAGRDNTLAAAEIEVVVHGTEFLDAYTTGDNRKVVATDTMKNFIHATSLRARARTLEEWLLEVGTAFLDTYPHMERLTMHGRELPFPAAVVPADDRDGFAASDRLFSRDRCDRGTARLELARDADGAVRITDHESGREGLQLIKITGSAFADFARDEHTTLPERRDRPLYIWLDISWRYTDASHAVLAEPARYVAAEQVADLAAAVVPADDRDGFAASDRLFSRDRRDRGTARLELARDADGAVRITDHESGREGLQLIKITGSAFADFARDE